MDMAAIGSAVTSLRVAGEIAKGLISLNTMAEVQAKAIELNSKLIQAQHDIFAANAEQSALVERIRALEGEIAAMKNWDAEKQRYQMATPYRGVTTYAVKKSMSNGEPPHYLCANCFQNGKRAILAQSSMKDGYVGIVCAVCKFIAQTQFRGVAGPKYAEDLTPET